ncbi:MAG: translation initiation factor IF-2 N-terminal domain-containing protein, partial [Clostridium sp.]|uniref:translation initiation factor IF-2 N-terminal domain-containing protein n=1 Tax=Clostridium sp. TaxID=1506 RepID=UPI003EE48C82
MSKIKVYELAKELGVSSVDLIELLKKEFNVVAKNHMSIIEEEDAELIKELVAEGGEDIIKKTLVDEYEDILAEEVNKGNRKKKKTRKQMEAEAAALAAAN